MRITELLKRESIELERPLISWYPLWMQADA